MLAAVALVGAGGSGTDSLAVCANDDVAGLGAVLECFGELLQADDAATINAVHTASRVNGAPSPILADGTEVTGRT
ncbi:MAG: hypothetical protein ABI912_10305 [Actinomycetota bacterium]